jgi:large subunit ribosomal protein L3
MAIGLLGKKLGMTHVYDEFGRRVAVTALKAGPCTIVSIREPKRDRYRAIQVGFEPVKESKLSRPVLGQFKKAKTTAFRYLREFRLPDETKPANEGVAEAASELAVGKQLSVDVFSENELVDVTGISIGKGFQGGMKRWHWSGGPATHGSTSHRAPGSIGSTTTPGRVWRGHHLPGHMGAEQVTLQNVRIVRLDIANHLMLIAGSIPGSEQGLVIVRKSAKRPGLIKKPRAFQAVIEEDEGLNKHAKAAKTKAPAKKG